jgi:flagellar basal-body rod protein FlgB
MSTTNPSSSISGSMIMSTMADALGHFLDVDVARYKLIAMNLANVDTPGYHTRDLDFRAELKRAANLEDNDGTVRLSSASFEPVARPIRGLMERPDGNNVSVEREGLLLAETQMKFNLGIQLLKDEFHSISMAINSGGTSS